MSVQAVQAVERVHFLEEQRRNRRRSARFSVFAVVAVALAGIPLCVILAPLLYGVVLVAAHGVDLVAPLPERQWELLHEVAFALPAVWNAVRGEPTRVTLGTLTLLYVAPGAIVMLVAWPLVRLLSRVGGAGTVLRRLPFRELDPVRLPEQQLRNLVQEMAVAAGVRPPAVRIIDSPAVNAVAIGLTTDDATILATTGFLQRLDRDERQAIVAHLVGSVGNGDLEIAATILSVFQTWGLMALLLETPLDARRRTLVRQFVRLSLDAVRGRADPDAARAMLDTFLAGSAFEFDEFFENLDNIRPESVGHACAVIVIHIPVIATIGLASIAAKQSITLFTNLILGPWLAPMWRARRRLADATAVQLTRHPDALARAIRDLEAADVRVDGGEAVNFLFPVWPAPSKETMKDATDVATFIVGMNPEPKPRLARLARLGASLESGALDARAPLSVRIRDALGPWEDVRAIPLLVIVAVLMLVVLVAVTLAAASVLLMALWVVLGWITGPLRWLRSAIAGATR